MSNYLSFFLAAWIGAAPAFGLGAARPLTAPLKFPNGKRIVVDLATTPDEQEHGLMFRTSLPKDYGMLFVFPSQQHLQFWMKNTWVPLDMIFIDRQGRITAIYQKVPRSFPETPEDRVARREGEGQYVLELPAGASERYRLKDGQRLSFGPLPPLDKNAPR